MRKLLFLLCLIFSAHGGAIAEDFIKEPQSVVWDSINTRILFIQNSNSTIFTTNSLDQPVKSIEGVFTNPHGLLIRDSILFVAEDKGVKLFNIKKNSLSKEVKIPGAAELTYLAIQNDSLYVCDKQAKTIYKIDISKNTYSKLELPKELNAPTALFFDGISLHILCDGKEIGIWKYMPQSNTFSKIKTIPGLFSNGITGDFNGNYYLSISANDGFGKIYHCASNFQAEPIAIASKLDYPAQLCYKSDAKSIIAPIVNENRLLYILVGEPDKVKLQYPDNNQNLKEYKIIFKWEKIKGVEKYNVEVALDTNFTQTVFNFSKTVNYSDLMVLDTSETYYWRVRAENLGKTGSWSNINKFKTGNLTYTSPILYSPVSGAMEVELLPKFIWSKSQAGRYEFQLSSSSDFKQLLLKATDLADTVFALTDTIIGPNSTYYWRVKTYSGVSESYWSEVSVFHTFRSAPSAPDLLYPGNGYPKIPRISYFEWRSVANADSYQLEISQDYYFKSDSKIFKYLRNSISGDKQVYKNTDTLERFSWYYWRVKAINKYGESSYSDVWMFQTMADDGGGSNYVEAINPHSVFPTPAQNILNITLNRTDMENANLEAFIYSDEGKIVKSISGLHLNQGQINIDVSDIPVGAYYFRIASPQNTIGGKFIKR
jgi:hypothetical protein